MRYHKAGPPHVESWFNRESGAMDVAEVFDRLETIPVAGFMPLGLNNYVEGGSSSSSGGSHRILGRRGNDRRFT